MLPLNVLVPDGEEVFKLLKFLFSNREEMKVEAEKRGIERAARIYTPILAETKELMAQLKSQYIFDKEYWDKLITEKLQYQQKLEKDLPKYKETYEAKLIDEMNQYNNLENATGGVTGAIGSVLTGGVTGGVVGGMAKFAGRIMGGPAIAASIVGGILVNVGVRVIGRKYIRKREEEIIAFENQGFERAKKLWTKEISECRENFNILKAKGNSEVQGLIEIYYECIDNIADFEQQIAYFQERVGDLG